MAPDADGPYGYMIDEETGLRRPKKRPGRRPKPTQTPPAPLEPSSSLESAAPDTLPLEQAEAEPEARTPLERTEDRAPADKRRNRSRRGRGAPVMAAAPKPPKEPKETIPFRAGPIAKGMNKLYRGIGRYLKKFGNRNLGLAFIAVTEKQDDDDITVGEAWEELARVNPAVRGVLMKLVTGGAVGGLFMAHLPILIAILMLEPVSKRIPLGNILMALMDKDDDDNEDQDDDEGGLDAFGGLPLGNLLAGMSQADMAQAVAFAQQMGDQIGMRAGGVHRGGE